MREKSTKRREGGTGGAAWNGGKGKEESQFIVVWIKYENWRGGRVGSRVVKDKKETLTRCESTWSGGK